MALSHILAKLKDEDGTILIPGIAEGISKPTEAELAAWKSLPFDEETYRAKQVGSPALVGEPASPSSNAYGLAPRSKFTECPVASRASEPKPSSPPGRSPRSA